MLRLIAPFFWITRNLTRVHQHTLACLSCQPRTARLPIASMVTTAFIVLTSALLNISAVQAQVQTVALPAEAQNHDATGDAESAFAAPPSTTGMLRMSAAGVQTEAVLLNTTMVLEVSGLLAQLHIEQQFSNRSDAWQEGQYLFPLPENAAIRALTIQVGARTIVGEIQTREQANKTYEQARDAGQLASVVEQERPNLFSIKVANIGPKQHIRIQLDVMLPVSYEQGQFELNLPTTYTPRYQAKISSPHNQHSTPLTDGPVAYNDQIHGPAFTLSARLDPISAYTAVSSSTHTLTSSNQRIVIGKSPMDRDVNLRWPAPLSTSAAAKVTWATHNEKQYAQMLLMPPEQNAESEARAENTARELILVVDQSGSMAGQSMLAAKAALNSALEGLSEHDSFNIIAFNHEYQRLFDSAKLASDSHMTEAERFIHQLEADGGTEMIPPLRAAMNSSDNNEHTNEHANKPLGQRLRQIIFVTDGSVDNEDALLRTIKQNIGDSRLFTVGIGSAPNAYLLEKAAIAGRGTSLSIAKTGMAQATIERLLKKLEQPVLTDLSVQWSGSGNVELYPNPLPDLYHDQPLMVMAQLQGDVRSIVIQGKQFDAPWRTELPIPAKHSTSSEPSSSATPINALAQAWGREKIESLMDEQRYAVDQEMHKAAITQLALEHTLVSKYTSFVAVDQVQKRPVEADLQQSDIANLMPAGNTMQTAARYRTANLPMGAAGSDTLLWMSLFSALLSLLLWYTPILSSALFGARR